MTYLYSHFHHWCVNADGCSVASFLSLHTAAATNSAMEACAMVLPLVRLWLREGVYIDTSANCGAATYNNICYRIRNKHGTHWQPRQRRNEVTSYPSSI